MKIEIYPAARASIKEIRQYTKKLWGKEQANKYIRGIGRAINQLSVARHLWRPVDESNYKGVFFVRYEHHYVFFRELGNQKIGIISVLHENMNIPSRLKEDSKNTSSLFPEKLEKPYREMASDKERESEAQEWVEALTGDVAEE